MGEVNEGRDDRIVIAVDGGGSKTDVVALDLSGTILARVKGPGSSPQILGIHLAVGIVDGLVREVIHRTGARPIAQVNAYISGLDLSSEIEDFATEIAEFDWALSDSGHKTLVDNDLFALLRAGTREPNAVAVVCGTGINAIGVRSDGETVRFPALGMISGDWGGGWFLGEQSLWHAARAADGRGPATSLRERIPEAMGMASVREVIEAIHFDRIPAAHLATLSPVLFACADSGDKVAGELIERQAEEIATMALTALRRLGLIDQAIPIVLGGGVVASENGTLLNSITRTLSQAAPNAYVKLVSSAPILGAALLTLEAAGAATTALDKAASAFGAATA